MSALMRWLGGSKITGVHEGYCFIELDLDNGKSICFETSDRKSTKYQDKNDIEVKLYGLDERK